MWTCGGGGCAVMFLDYTKRQIFVRRQIHIIIGWMDGCRLIARGAQTYLERYYAYRHIFVCVLCVLWKWIRIWRSEEAPHTQNSRVSENEELIRNTSHYTPAQGLLDWLIYWRANMESIYLYIYLKILSTRSLTARFLSKYRFVIWFCGLSAKHLLILIEGVHVSVCVMCKSDVGDVCWILQSQTQSERTANVVSINAFTSGIWVSWSVELSWQLFGHIIYCFADFIC